MPRSSRSATAVAGSDDRSIRLIGLVAIPRQPDNVPVLTATPTPTRRQSFLPLTIAAAIIYRAFLGDRQQLVRTEEEMEKHLDEAARTISIAIPIYRLDLADPAVIDNATIAHGSFMGGARSLRFPDGRPSIDSLGVYKPDLDRPLSKFVHIVPETRPETIVPSKFLRPKI